MTSTTSATRGRFVLSAHAGVTVALTVNPDFAEVEADQRVVNLTRFPLFLPEKRRFFLEDSNLFSFDAGSFADTNDLVPFFSRRIGLDPNAFPIPIDFGAKMSGYVGPWNGGFLGTVTRETDTIPEKDLYAGRLSYDLNAHSSVGGIFTSGNPVADPNNQVLGANYTYTTDSFTGGKNLDFNVFLLKSWTEGLDGNDRAMGARLSYPNDLWSWAVEAREIGDSFFPALGFVERTGIRQYDGSLAWQPRPGATSESFVSRSRRMF